jgi:hypothetical protein
MRKALAAGLLLLVTGCVPDFDLDLSVVTAPRVVAVQSRPGEGDEREAIELSALVVAPDAAPVPEWALCLERKPLVELGPISPLCLDRSRLGTGSLFPLGSGASVGASVPDQACRLFGPNRPEPKQGEPPGRPVDPDFTGGYYQPVVAFLDGEIAIGGVRVNCGLSAATPQKLLDYRDRYRKNENPLLDAVELMDSNGAATRVFPADPAAPALRVAAGASYTLRASWRACPVVSECGDGICGAGEDAATCAADCTMPHGCTGAEPYVFLDPLTQQLADRREGILLSWYITAGKFANERTGVSEADPPATESVNQWTAPAAPGSAALWVVVQDDRGGTSWTSVALNIGS